MTIFDELLNYNPGLLREQKNTYLLPIILVGFPNDIGPPTGTKELVTLKLLDVWYIESMFPEIQEWILMNNSS